MRPRQLVIWLLLALLALAIVVIETTGILEPKVTIDRHGHVIQETTDFLPADLSDITVIEIAKDGVTYRFERDHHSIWFYHDHQHENGHDHGEGHGSVDDEHHAADATEAEQIANAFSALGRAKIERYLARAKNPANYGVTKPDMLINIYGENTLRPLARFAVGDLAPDTFSRYVMVVGSFAIITIPNYQIENLLALIETVTETTSEH